MAYKMHNKMRLDPEDYILSVRGLSKSFSGIKALDNILFNLKRGEIHALVGENGAGKSTFMKILIGLHEADSGEVILEGQSIHAHHRGLERTRSISMIHQEMLVVPELTVAQNIYLGREKALSGNGKFWLNEQEISIRAAELLSRMEIDLSPDVPMKYLSVAETQMIEIAKAVSNEAKVIIMDEPTSALSEREIRILFKTIAELKKNGVSMIYISHKMEEILEIADTVTVLRDGQYIGTHSTSNVNREKLIELMVGRQITDMFPKKSTLRKDLILSVRKLTSLGKFSDVSFDVYGGEVLGVAGLMGAGRTEIARAIFGLDPIDSGEIWLENKKVKIHSPRDAIRLGIGYVGEDRKAMGFIPDLSVRDNITLTSLKNYTKGIFLDNHLENVNADRMTDSLKIKSAGRDQKIRQLSGGNQQKVVIAKMLLSSPKVLILDEPTRGIDIGAKFEIYKLIRELTNQGLAVVMISSELTEILGMSDRIMVLSEGKQKALLSAEEATQQNIMNYAVH